jgi:hypothetical protein
MFDIVKKLLTPFAVVALFATTGFAQVTNLNQIQATPEVKAAAISFYQGVSASHSLTVAVYPTYAPSIVVDGKKSQFGAGIAAIYPLDGINALSNNVVAKHTFAGLRFDLIGGKYFASTVALGAKADFQLWSHNFTVFGESGANIPLSGAGNNNVALGAMVGTGIETRLFSFGKPDANGVKPFSIDIFVLAEKWTLYSGEVFHGGPVLNWSF